MAVHQIQHQAAVLVLHRCHSIGDEGSLQAQSIGQGGWRGCAWLHKHAANLPHAQAAPHLRNSLGSVLQAQLRQQPQRELVRCYHQL
jgi:hypothetical protein